MSLPICSRCKNHGFYEMLAKQDTGQNLKMFCVCPFGKEIRELTLELRLNDLDNLAKSLLPKIQEAREKLHAPEEANKLLEEVINEVTDIMQATEKVLFEGE